MTRLTARAYTVAWLCALPQSELVAATAMLDEEHVSLRLPIHDDNSYTYGSINGHNVVIACLPPGQPGKVSAAKLVQPLSQSFPNLRMHLFVGIGSGIPRFPPPDHPDDDIHLGDVVIGWAEKTGAPGVVQWDFVRHLADGAVEPLGSLDKPARRLLSALGLVLRNRILERTRLPEHFERLQNLAGFSHPGLEHDKLFKSTYDHVGGPDCSSCDRVQLTERLPRVHQNSVFHQGTILSGDTIMNNPQRRDEISRKYHGALCFENEAAGVMDDKHCLIIRGIADYADSHNSDLWQNYAAGTAAAFAREFLFTIQPQDVNGLESTSVAKLHFMVPFQRHGNLIGREKYIQTLESKLCVPNKYCRVALVGLGGIGKTRIALEYVSKLEKSDSVSVFWVYAGTAERMENAYQEIAKEAGLAGAEDSKVNQLQLVKQWLEGDDSGNWVMVIDNADDKNLFYGEDENQGQGPPNFSSRLAQYFPRRLNGSILLTTRNKKLGVRFAGVKYTGTRLTTVGSVITVAEMDVPESKKLLMENLEEDTCDDRDLTELVELLENLPLALVQAAAFIRENSGSIGKYLRTYRGSDASKIKLLSQNFEDSERDPDSKNPVAVTWAISFEQIRNSDPQAAKTLSLMSILDRQAIPRSFLSSNIEEVDLDIALGTLKAYSLISEEQSSEAFNLHRLVYLATRNWLNMNTELCSWTGKSLVLLSELFPFPEFENREIWMGYLPHAHTVLNSNHLPVSEDLAQATLLVNVSSALLRNGDFDEAEVMAKKSLDLRDKVHGGKDLKTLYSVYVLVSVLRKQRKDVERAEDIGRQLLNILEEMLGKEHPDTLRSLGILGLVLCDQGKYDAAEECLRRELSARENIQGKEPLNTLQSINSLAVVLGRQGKEEAAEIMHRRALSDCEEILGKEHPYTLQSINNLALALGKRGRFEEAENLHRRALSGYEKQLGKEHRDTISNVNNLAVVLEQQGKHEEAKMLHGRALSAGEKKLGKEHRDTLQSITNLAWVLGEQGQFKEAERLHRRALSGRWKILGKEHRDTLTNVDNLANVLQRQARYDEAVILYQQVLSGREKLLGKEHLDTLQSLNNLALVLGNQGKFEEAERLHRKALDDCEKILGKVHSHTLAIVNHLAIGLGKQRKYEAAEKLNRRALDDCEKILGIEHYHTLTIVDHLAFLLGKQGKIEETEKLNRRALSAREKMLGKDHPDTLQSLTNLTLVLEKQEKFEEAEEIKRRALSSLEETLGKDHAHTLTIVNNLANLLQRQARYEEAVRLYQRALSGRENLLGKEHPDTLVSVWGLAHLYGKRRQYEISLELYQRALAGFQKSLGSDQLCTQECAKQYKEMLANKGQDSEAPDTSVTGEGS